jgi:hypothetical protein
MIMVLAMCAYIVFPATAYRGEISVRKIAMAEVKTSWKLLTDTAMLELPRNTVDFNKIGTVAYDKKNVRDVFRYGDQVQIKLGFNGVLIEEFSGYITEVGADIPITIRCQDEMWKLKQTPVNVSLKKATLEDLLKVIMPSGYTYDANPIELGSVRYANVTVAKVLEKLKQDYNLYSYMNGKQLVVGKIYTDNQDNIHKINIDHMPGNNLVYKRADERQVLIKAVSTKTDGTKIEATAGDEGGEEYQLTYYGISSVAELKKLAELDYEKYKVDGYEGDLEIYGNLDITHGDKVELHSPLFPDRDGIYYVDEITATYDDSPMYHKKLTIGGKAV